MAPASEAREENSGKIEARRNCINIAMNPINNRSKLFSNRPGGSPIRLIWSRGILSASVLFFAGAAQITAGELLRNGASDPEGASAWSIYVENQGCGKTAVALDPAVGHLAPGSFRMSPVQTNLNASATVHQSIPVTAGRTYELKGWVMGRNLAGSRTKAGVQAEFRTAEGGKFLGREVVKAVDENTTAGEWRPASLRVKVPDGTGWLTFAAWGEFQGNPDGGTAAEVFFDDLSLTGGERKEYGASLRGGEGLGLWWCDDMRKIMRDQPVPNAKSPVVVVEAARNEYEPFQLCLRPGEELRGVRFETVGAPEGVTLDFFQEEYVPVLKPMDEWGEASDYPDPLVPVEGPLNLAAEKNHPFWVDLKVGEQVPAGEHAFKVMLLHEGDDPVTIPIRLKVQPFALPTNTTIRTAFGVDVWPKWHGDLSTEQLKTVWKKYLTMVTSHRLSPMITFTYGAFPWKPKVLSADPATGVVTCDFSAFDEIMGLVLDENHANSFSLNLQPPPDLVAMGKERKWNEKQMESVTAAYQQALVAHVKEKSWLEKCYLYAYDEPTPDHYPQLVSDLQKIKTQLPGLRRLIAFNNSVVPNEQFKGHVDIWVPAIHKINHWESAQARRRGDQVWYYVMLGPGAPYPNLFIDHPTSSHRVLPWMAWQFNLDGLLYWNTTWSKFTNPWKETMTHDEKPGQYSQIIPYANGDGLLLYPPVREPATAPVVAGPIPTIRIKLLREGLEDTEYLTLLRQHSAADPALRLSGDLVQSTTSFELHPEHYLQARRELAEAIVKAGDMPAEKVQEKAAEEKSSMPGFLKKLFGN
ncbi:MAG: DUF4091 domain-containing protein [Verrucomicrobia bacterium]|nr:DUF4091 domain-containing protein [Verrucomicrobiota bacterium]